MQPCENLLVVLTVLAGLFVLAAYLLAKETLFKSKQGSSDEASYLIDVNQTIDREEAASKPPIERWKVIKDLSETTAIEVICYPNYYTVTEARIVGELVRALQNSQYVEASDYPDGEPDVKVYFRKKDGFVMAGRLHVGEGVLASPEGPLIKIDQMAALRLMENTECGDP